MAVGTLVARSTAAATGILSPRSRNLPGLLFSLPLLALFACFVVYPLFFVVSRIFDRYTYEVLFSDPVYVQTIVNTVVYVGVAVNVKLFLALLLSGVLDSEGKATRFLSAIFLLPWAIPVLPGILSVRWMMSSQWGILNLISEDLGLGTHHWLASRWTAIGAIILFHIWKYLPFWTVIFLSARRGIPRQLYEAASIDGAGPLQTFRYISLPMLGGIYLICTLLSMVFTMGDFTNVQLMTGGGPGDSTHVLATLAYRYTFRMGKIDWGMGVFATALPVTLLFIFVLIKKIRYMTARGLGVNAARGAVLAVITLWTLFPIYYIVSLAVTPWTDLFRPVYWVAHPTLDNFKFVIFQESPFVKFFWRWLANSLWVSAATMGAVLVVAAMGSFALGRIRFGLGRWVSGITLFTYIIPASFLSIPFFKIMGDYDLLDTYWALIFAMTTFAAPYALWVLWDYAKTIPQEIDESAAMDGAGLVAVFFRIYLPLITPSLIAIGTYAFFYAWNEYLYAVLLLQGEKTITLPVGMGNFLTSDDAPWNLLMALSVIYAIPPVLFYYVFRRYLTHGLVSGSVQGT